MIQRVDRFLPCLRNILLSTVGGVGKWTSTAGVTDCKNGWRIVVLPAVITIEAYEASYFETGTFY